MDQQINPELPVLLKYIRLPLDELYGPESLTNDAFLFTFIIPENYADGLSLTVSIVQGLVNAEGPQYEPVRFEFTNEGVCMINYTVMGQYTLQGTLRVQTVKPEFAEFWGNRNFFFEDMEAGLFEVPGYNAPTAIMTGLFGLYDSPFYDAS